MNDYKVYFEFKREFPQKQEFLLLRTEDNSQYSVFGEDADILMDIMRKEGKVEHTCKLRADNNRPPFTLIFKHDAIMKILPLVQSYGHRVVIATVKGWIERKKEKLRYTPKKPKPIWVEQEIQFEFD